MKLRSLGAHGLEVSAVGYGAMVLTGCYGAVGEAQALAAVRHAQSLGINFFDTSDAYGDGQVEELLGRALAGRRAGAIVATKFGIVFDENVPATPITVGSNIHLRINGRPEYVAQAVDRSLARLQTDVIDLWYAHYPDPGTPIEETVGAMAEQVRKGKVRYLGLSNASAAELRRAQKAHPITAVQAEYSLFDREAERDLLPAARELGIGFVPWAPLGRGFLSGAVTEVPPDDFRQNIARFAPDALPNNNARFAPVWRLATGLGISPAQLALAWLLQQYASLAPIPGSRQPEHIAANAAAADIQLSAEQLAELGRVAPAES